MARNDPTSELLAATEAVEAEIKRFEDATASFRKINLNSQKNLERATRALNDLAEGDQKVIDSVQVLVKAIGTVRDRQMAQVEHIRAKAEEIKARSVIFHELEEALQALGEDAAGLSAKLKQAPDVDPPVELDAEMGELAGKAKSLAERATSGDFDDLSRVADGLRQQILAVRAKLKLITKPSASA
jgi:hypothetical protein